MRPGEAARRKHGTHERVQDARHQPRPQPGEEDEAECAPDRDLTDGLAGLREASLRLRRGDRQESHHEPAARSRSKNARQEPPGDRDRQLPRQGNRARLGFAAPAHHYRDAGQRQRHAAGYHEHLRGQAQPLRALHGLGAVAHAELAVERARVLLDRVR